MKTSKTPATAPRTAVAQVHELPNLPFSEIKALWRKLFGGETPTHNRQFLERQLAYKLQEVEFRKVDPGLLDRNNKKIASLIATGKLRKRDRDFHPTPGTLFTREYHGKAPKIRPRLRPWMPSA